MTELVNMLMPPDKEGAMGEAPTNGAADNKPCYPWGLKINLDDDVLDKLGFKTLPTVGQTMTLTARVSVCSISQYDGVDDGDRSVGLQITDMALGPDQKGVDAAKLYDGS